MTNDFCFWCFVKNQIEGKTKLKQIYLSLKNKVEQAIILLKRETLLKFKVRE